MILVDPEHNFVKFTICYHTRNQNGNFYRYPSKTMSLHVQTNISGFTISGQDVISNRKASFPAFSK